MLTNRLEPLNTRKWPKKCAVVKRPQHLRATFSFLILILFIIIFTNPPSNCNKNRATTLVSTSLSPHHFLQITSYSSLPPCVENILKSYVTQPKSTTALHSSKRHNDNTKHHQNGHQCPSYIGNSFATNKSKDLTFLLPN